MYYIGVDIGGTNIKTGVVDKQGNILKKHSFPTLSSRPYQEIVQDINLAITKLLNDLGIKKEQIQAIGIGSPGSVDSKTGVIIYSNNIQWKNVSLGSELTRLTGLPTYVHNDANAAAMGEWMFGAGKGYKDIVLITIGTGIGGGVVINGDLLEGNYSAGAEIGHTRLGGKGNLCTCGRTDCFETYASATALIRMTKQAMQDNPDSKMWDYVNGDINKTGGRTAFECAKAGDSAAQKVIDEYIYYLGEGIANMANIFRPDIIILGGGVCAQGESLTKPLQKHLDKNIYAKDLLPTVQIITAKLGNDAGIIGAAALGINKHER
ncbi:MAG TPA: ROK family protein [Clostridiales bacterium]|nr:ROK family protein [Clostridiales bacterium]